MLFQEIQEAVKTSHKVCWKEENENSPIRLKTMTKDKEETIAQVKVLTAILLKWSNEKPIIEKTYIRIKIPYEGTTLQASIYGNATMQIQGKGCGRWLASKIKEILN